MRQVALVTGSSRGIGLAAAQALAREGFAIALNSPVEDDELRIAVEQIQSLDVPCVAAPFDVADLRAHEGVLDRIEAAIGPMTTLVNNTTAISTVTGALPAIGAGGVVDPEFAEGLAESLSAGGGAGG